MLNANISHNCSAMLAINRINKSRKIDIYIQIFKHIYDIYLIFYNLIIKSHLREKSKHPILGYRAVYIYFVGFKLIFRNIHKSRAVAMRPITVCISYNRSKISVVNNSGNALRRQGT